MDEKEMMKKGYLTSQENAKKIDGILERRKITVKRVA